MTFNREVVRSEVPGPIRFTDDEQRRLVDAALAMGRKAMRSVVTTVKPETMLAWQPCLEQKKWDYWRGRRRGPRRPWTAGETWVGRPRDIEPRLALDAQIDEHSCMVGRLLAGLSHL